MTVVVPLLLTKHRGGVPLIDDQEAVEELTAKGADEAFGDGVGPRRSYRRLDDPDVGRGEYGVEGRDELGVTVADQEPEATAGVIQIQRLRACWVSHAPVGRVVTPRMCTRRVACSMTKNA